MSPPPTSIDGTDITGATIDGQDVQEITVDGQTVFAALPDSVTNRWPSDEGSGTTLADSLGDTDISLTFNRWASGSQFNGGAAPDYDSPSDDLGEAVDLGANDSAFSLGFWTDNISADAGFSRLAIGGDGSTNSTVSNGWRLTFGSTLTTLRLRHRSGGSSSTVTTATIDDAATNQLFYAVTLNGDSGEIYVYDTGGQIANSSGSATRSLTTNGHLVTMGESNGFTTGGQQDDIVAAIGSTWSESEVDTVFNNTGPNS